MGPAAGQVAVIVILMDGMDGGCGIHDRPALLAGMINHPVIPTGAADGEIRHFAEEQARKDKIVAAGGQMQPAAGFDIPRQPQLPPG